MPGNPDVEMKEVFAEQYQQFMENKPGNEEVVFVDAVHPQHNSINARGLFETGADRLVPINSGRERINLHGVLNMETLDVIVVAEISINSHSTIGLLHGLSYKYSQAERMHIIFDNARCRYSKEVQQYVEEHGKINLVFDAVFTSIESDRVLVVYVQGKRSKQQILQINQELWKGGAGIFQGTKTDPPHQ